MSGPSLGVAPDWLRQHGNDEVPVKLADLLCLVARLEQYRQDPGLGTLDRLFTCDLPRMRGDLPPEALEEL